jgi:3'(2'), 5'-bisphosphate nucleotidase
MMMMAPLDHARLAAALLPAVLRAGAAILDHRRTGFEVERKSDTSPVTAADRAAEAILLEALGAAAPGIPVIAEELASAGTLPQHGARFFLVDALDGTREFVKGGDDFTINIGLIDGGKPVFGIVYAPASSWLFATLGPDRAVEARIAPGEDADRVAYTTITGRRPDENGMCAVVSKSHLDDTTKAYLATLQITSENSIGSSLKFCVLARGDADVYPRFGPTCEWDTAAGHAVLTAAGGIVLTPERGAFTYGKTGKAYLNSAFIAWGRDGPWVTDQRS